MSNQTPDVRALGRRGDLAEDITDGLAKAVMLSFEKRPMLRITEAEAKRRLDIAYEAWRTLVADGGYEPSRALIAVPTVLVEIIDREQRCVLPVLIDTEFETKILPLHMSDRIEMDRALSALAKIHGTVDVTTLPESKS